MIEGMDPDATLPPPSSLGDQLTVGYESGEPPRHPPTATDLADDAPDVPGYVVQKELGRGGMGVVYLARQVNLNRSVALKLLPSGKQLGALVRQRFQAEAESAAKIAHPGVVGVYEVGEHAGRPYFALEFCPGGSLATKLAGTPLPPRQAAELVEAVARAVQAAHDAGVVHRDLKPDNVLFAADHTPKVADFGLAKPVQTDSHLTTDGAILGTPSYMAPEQARGDSKQVGPPADGYALGAVLYECLTGRPPFRAATLMETLSQVINAEPVSPRKLAPGLPKDLETVCLKCLEKDPARRYPSAAAVAADLRSWLDGRPIVARPVSLPERAWKTLRRRPEIGVVAGVVCAAVGTVVGVLASSNASLTRERNAAVVARQESEAARGEADAQRQKADARLAAAVDAVEAMVGHTAAESWSLSGQLQDERRKFLADAVAFYERLAAGDGDDPVVRRESGKANLRAGKAWLALGDNPKAEAACRTAVGLYADLQTANPADPAAAAALAESRAYLGHTLAVRGDYPAALTEYTAAKGLAERAVAGNPQDADATLTLVRSHANLANFHLVGDPSRALAEATAAADLAGKLAAPPDAPPLHRLAQAESLVLVGNAHLTGRRFAEAGGAFDRAKTAFAGVAGAKTNRRPGRGAGELGEATLRVKAMLDTQPGAVRLNTAKGPADLRAALALFRNGLVTIDALLKGHPKAFPYRVMKYQTLAAVVETCHRLGDAAGRDQATAEVDKLGAEILADTPSATWVLAGGAMRRTRELLAAVEAGKFDRFAAEAADLLKLADGLPAGGVGHAVRYNVACGFAQMAAVGPGPDRERHAAAAVGLLAKLAADDYFRRPSAAKDLATDTDLDPLRGRGDFKAVAARVLESKDR